METLNHGILRFNDECTLKIDFDQSTDDMTVTRFNDVTGEETAITGGGGDFESGTIVGDNSTSQTIPVSKLYTNFIIYWTDPQTHNGGDVMFAGGTSSLFIGIIFNDAGTNAKINLNDTGSYLKFYDTHIDITFVISGGYKPLHSGGIYQWIAF